MQKERWAAACAFMASVWHRPIGQVEQAAGLKLLGQLPDAAVEGAIRVLAESGREMMPPWSVVYKLAQDMRGQFQLALADPDLTRDLTPDEQARATEMAARIKARITEIAQAKELAQVVKR